MSEREPQLGDAAQASLPERSLTEGMKAELTGLAAMALEIERALRDARQVAAELAEMTDELASRACDAERSLSRARSHATGLDAAIGRGGCR